MEAWKLCARSFGQPLWAAALRGAVEPVMELEQAPQPLRHGRSQVLGLLGFCPLRPTLRLQAGEGIGLGYRVFAH